MRIYSSDAVWRQILRDLGADVTDDVAVADLDFDALIPQLPRPATLLDIKGAILNAIDDGKVMRQIFGHDVKMPRLQMQIVKLLYKNGAMSGADLRRVLGYAPNATTHAVDTAIYQLRRTYGHDFIINDNGVYKIGKL